MGMAIVKTTKQDENKPADSARPTIAPLVSIAIGEWRDRLTCDRNGTPKRTLDNCLTALEHAPEWSKVLAWNELKSQTVVLRRPPWGGAANSRPWSDQDDRLAARWFQQQNIDVGLEVASSAIVAHSQSLPINPLTDWLTDLEWDGWSRIGAWLRDYFGVTHTEYSSEIGRKWLISAVARAFDPGCKADNCLVLEGKEGIRKSTALRILAGEEYFTDQMPTDYNREAPIHLEGVWIVEFSDLEGIEKNTGKVEAVKAFLSRTQDRYRPMHGKHVVVRPRRCVWAATTNREVYLPGETGNRRFWPVRCEHVNITDLIRDREQLWAEAVKCYLEGERWYLDGATEQLARWEQMARYEEDPWHEPVAKYCHSRFDVSVNSILEQVFRKTAADITAKDQQRVVRCLKALGFSQYRVPKSGARRYEREKK
jgi:putative DNA primase/helicase